MASRIFEPRLGLCGKLVDRPFIRRLRAFHFLEALLLKSDLSLSTGPQAERCISAAGHCQQQNKGLSAVDSETSR